jgi:Nucleotidyltransferase of unknown function (DUF6036)
MATDIAASLPKPWPDFLMEVDALLSRTVNLHCIGGFVVTALYGISRFTADLDYIQAVPQEARGELEKLAGVESALCKKYRLFFQSVGIADVPDEYASRLQELKVGLKKLELSALDPYDLLLSKVSRNSPKDREDARYLIAALKLDFKTFRERWEKEMVPWIANRQKHELTIELWKEYFPN